MVELLKSLSEAKAPSGCENDVRELILREISGKTDSVTVDSMGNIIAFKKGKTASKRIAVTAHMDEAGLIISEITDKGYLKFKLVGNIDPRVLVSKRVVVGKGVKGIIGMKAIHLQTKDEREDVKKAKDLFIDIGAKDKADAEKKVKLGDYVVFDTNFAQLDKSVKGKALERSGACYSLISALDNEFPYDFYAVFTAQHEVGSRGAAIAAHRINADAVLTVSAAEATDMYECVGGVKLFGGTVISHMGKNIIADRCLTDKFIALASQRNIQFQKNASKFNSFDGGAMQIMDTKALCIGIPCRYSLSPVSIMNLDDIDSATELIKLFLNEIGDLI